MSSRGRYALARPASARRDSSDDGHEHEHEHDPLARPRPSFLAAARDSMSWYSVSDPASDSEREQSSLPALRPTTTTSSSSSRTSALGQHDRAISAVSSSVSYMRAESSESGHHGETTGVREPLLSPSESLRSATMLPPPPSSFEPPQSTSPPPPPISPQPQPTPHSPPPAPQPRRSTFPRAPPTSFPYPFLAHAGNPDPLPTSSSSSTGLKSRQGSLDSLPHRHAVAAWGEPELERPHPPFMSRSLGGGGLYHSASTGALHQQQHQTPPPPPPHEPSPRTSTASFRTPFLSPASRPSSVVWSPPPTYIPSSSAPGSATTGTSTPLPGPKPPLPSTLLAQKLDADAKPWLRVRERRSRASYWLTMLVFFFGVGAAAVLAWRGYVDAGLDVIPDGRLCAVFEDEFDSLDIDTDGSRWTRNVSLGGFGNSEFEMTTNSDNNLFVKNGQLYLMPTLTTDTGGLSYDQLFDGGTITLSGCTAPSKQNCTVSSSNASQTTVPPVQSARLSTMRYANSGGAIRYGKVEVVAKLPRGDWLWPAIWMLPVDETYGPWPASGEIDIMEARGNGIAYAQGINFVRSTLNWGPSESLIARAYGWQSMKQRTYADGFHTYTLEWTDSFMKMYVDSRLKAMVDLRMQGPGGGGGAKSFWDRGRFPQVAQNGSSLAVVQDPYGGAAAAPFDQPFYLVLDLAVGGTSGWFPDNVGGKPWFDGSATAVRQFAANQPVWSQTWPSDEDERAFRIDSVKMWKLC